MPAWMAVAYMDVRCLHGCQMPARMSVMGEAVFLFSDILVVGIIVGIINVIKFIRKLCKNSLEIQ